METPTIDLCDEPGPATLTSTTATTQQPLASASSGGWMRRRSRRIDSAKDTQDDDRDAERSPSSRTPPPSGTVARHPLPVTAFAVDSTVSVPAVYDKNLYEDDDGDDDGGDNGGQHSEVPAPIHDALVSQIIEVVEGAAAAAVARPEPETPNVCALDATHRLARLDGMAERLAEAATEHRRHRAQQPGGRFSTTLRRRARTTKANDFVRERFRIAQALAKHYNELFHPRGHRFVGRPEASTASQGASTATRGFRARMALFWLDTLVRFDRTFNTTGDLPAPSVAHPLSAREMVPLHDDPVLAAASLADKFEPPDERARQRKRPLPRPTARVDFAGGAGSSRRQRRQTGDRAAGLAAEEGHNHDDNDRSEDEAEDHGEKDGDIASDMDNVSGDGTDSDDDGTQ